MSELPEFYDDYSRWMAQMVEEHCLTSFPMPSEPLTIEKIEDAMMKLGMVNWDQELKELMEEGLKDV